MAFASGQDRRWQSRWWPLVTVVAILASVVVLEGLIDLSFSGGVAVVGLTADTVRVLSRGVVGLMVVTVFAAGVRRRWPAVGSPEGWLTGVGLSALVWTVVLVRSESTVWIGGTADGPTSTILTVIVVYLFPAALVAVVADRRYGLTVWPWQRPLYSVGLGGVALCAGLVTNAIAIRTGFLDLAFMQAVGDQPALASQLLWEVAGANLLIGIGIGVLYCGVLQGLLRRAYGRTAGIAAVTALVPVSMLATTGLGAAYQSVLQVVLALVACVLAMGFVRLGPDWPTDEHRSAGLAVICGVAVVVSMLGAPQLIGGGSPTLLTLLSIVPITVVAGCSAVGFDRTGSVWVAAVPFVLYLAVTAHELLVLVAGP